MSHLISEIGNPSQMLKMHNKNRGNTFHIQKCMKLPFLSFYGMLINVARKLQKKSGKNSVENIFKSVPPIYMMLFEPSRTVLSVIQSSTHRRTIYKAPYDHALHGDKRDYI